MKGVCCGGEESDKIYVHIVDLKKVVDNCFKEMLKNKTQYPGFIYACRQIIRSLIGKISILVSSISLPGQLSFGDVIRLIFPNADSGFIARYSNAYFLANPEGNNNDSKQIFRGI